MSEQGDELHAARVLDGPLVVGGHEFTSRLIVGTGKYTGNEIMVDAIRASGAEMVTVAVRRVDLDRTKEEAILHHLSPDEFFLLANTAGCYTAEDALRYARLARAAGFNEWIKLEVIGDEATLLPDVAATLETAKILADEGFKVMAYTNDDPIMAKRLEDAGAAAVMPLASPIGSGLGIQNRYNVQFVKEAVKVPVIVDAGVGCASDAAIAMELGADGVLTNTAIACAKDPIMMAEAMKNAVIAGRLSYLAGRIPMKAYATASSPIGGLVNR